MADKVRRRVDRECPICQRKRHRVCDTCGQRNLIGTLGQAGLYDHETLEKHLCAGTSHIEEYDGDDSDDGRITKNIDINSAAGYGLTVKVGDVVNINGEVHVVTEGGASEDSGGTSDIPLEGKGEGKQGQGKSPLDGKNFALTGVMSLTREEMRKKGEDAGGNYQANVNNQTDFLVQGDDAENTGKVRAAKERGTDIISEQQFMDMLKGQQGQGSGQSENEDEVTNDDLVGRVIDVLKPRTKELMGFDKADFDELERRVSEAAQEAIDTARETQVISIEVNDASTQTVVASVTGAHEQTTTLLQLMDARVNIMIVGPAGSGKTRGVQEAAKALSLGFYPKSVGPATTEHSLFGYMDANGNYIAGIMRKPFEEGGVLLIDEIDAGNPACLTAMNTALANEYCSFPDAVVERHPDFIAVASGNTYGRGADRQYVGRNQMDAATLDRFIMLPWDYDKSLERALINDMINQTGNNDLDDWLKKVWQVRKAVEDTQERFVVGTRTVLDGAKLINKGFSLAKTEQLRIWNACGHETQQRLVAAMSNP